MAKEKHTEEEQNKTQQGQNNPGEAMKSPEDVDRSNDENIDEDFPGYPHYPAKDDILNPQNHTKRVDIDVDNLTRSNAIDPLQVRQAEGVAPVEGLTADTIPEDNDDDIGIVPGTEADVTAEDLLLLGPRDGDMDGGEDEELAARGWKPQTGADLDIPDADLNGPVGDAMGEEDEENSYYSLGGDSKDRLEEDVENNF